MLNKLIAYNAQAESRPTHAAVAIRSLNAWLTLAHIQSTSAPSLVGNFAESRV